MNPLEWVAYLLVPVAVFSAARVATNALAQYRQETGASYLLQQSKRRADQIFIAVSLKVQLYLTFILGGIVALVALWLTHSVILPILVALVCLVAPYFIRKRLQAKRLRRFEEQFPDALALLSSTLRAGISMPLAVSKVADESESPLAEEFGLLKREIQLGRTEQGFRELSDRLPVDSVKLFVTAVITCMKMGGNLAEMSDSIAQTIRGNIELRGELRALTAEGRLQGMMMAAMPFVVVGLIALVNPDMVEPLFTTWVGNIMIGVVLVLELVGVLIIREMLKIED